MTIILKCLLVRNYRIKNIVCNLKQIKTYKFKDFFINENMGNIKIYQYGNIKFKYKNYIIFLRNCSEKLLMFYSFKKKNHNLKTRVLK